MHDVDLVLLTVPDDAIAEVAGRIEVGTAVLVHVSGAKTLATLEPHRRRASVHPLLSMPDPILGAERLLGGGVFAVAGDEIAATIVETLGGRAIGVPDDRRAVYHGAAAVASNHLVALCAQVERLADQAGVPHEAYWELMAGSLDNVRAMGAAAALTGPAARGDRATVTAHVEAINPDERALYLVLADAAADLAGQPRPSEHRPE